VRSMLVLPFCQQAQHGRADADELAATYMQQTLHLLAGFV
jgi:hypothetical protein